MKNNSGRNIRRLGLREEGNEAYYSLVERHNEIMAEWNRLNNDLHSFKPGKIPLRKHKKILLKRGRGIDNLQKDFLQWYNDASDFLLKPNIVVDPGEESKLTFLHYTGFLSHMISEANHNMVLLVDNYQKRYNALHNQWNFMIAITSFVLTFLGLLVTAYALIISS